MYNLIPGDAVTVSLIPNKRTAITTPIAEHTIRAIPATLGNQNAATAIGSGRRKITNRPATELQKSILLRVKLLIAPIPK
jgi:hypothetical protein